MRFSLSSFDRAFIERLQIVIQTQRIAFPDVGDVLIAERPAHVQVVAGVVHGHALGIAAWSVVMAAAIADTALAVCLLDGFNICNPIPAMPYQCCVILALACVAFSVLFAVGCAFSAQRCLREV